MHLSQKSLCSLMVSTQKSDKFLSACKSKSLGLKYFLQERLRILLVISQEGYLSFLRTKISLGNFPLRKEKVQTGLELKEKACPLWLSLKFGFMREGKVDLGASFMLLILAHQDVKKVRNSEQRLCHEQKLQLK